MVLSLKTFGSFAIRDDVGTELLLPTRKTRALLAYLVFNANKPQPRERLMALLWGERDERQARQSLNDALAAIRRLSRMSGTVLLNSDSEQVTLHGTALESDVGRFHALVDADPASAAALYDGPFLDGLSVPDPAFEDWLIATRSALHTKACNALERAAESAAERDESDEAINRARRLIELDPLREGAYRLLMSLLYAKGDRVGALQQYKAYAEILEKELQIAPDASTQALLEKIRQDAAAPELSALMTQTSAEPVQRGTAVLPLSDKPSIAVLPFNNLSGDADQEYFAAGLVEDLITSLSKVPEILVIARISTLPYKGKAVDVRQVAKELGVSHVLEGSVQKSGNRLRVTVQLIEGANGTHIWSERYDRKVQGLFDLQDEIIRNTIIEMQVKLTVGEHARVASRGTQNLDAWLLWVQGFNEAVNFTREGHARARELFEAASKADPNWGHPFGGIAWTYREAVRRGWSTDRERDICRGIALAQKAIDMDHNDPVGYMMLGSLYVEAGRFDEGISLSERAVEIAPSFFTALWGLADHLVRAGEARRALEMHARAKRVIAQGIKYFFPSEAIANHLLGHHDEAINILKGWLQRKDRADVRCLLAAVYADVGRVDEAHAEIKRALEQKHDFRIKDVMRERGFVDPKLNDWYIDLLKKTGLPD